MAPALTYNGDDGEYLAVWQDWSVGSGGSGYDAIWGQRVHGTAAGGTLAGSAFEVSGTEQADSALPAVTFYADGGSGGLYLVAWEQTVSGGVLDLQARRVLTGGTTAGSVITLTAATGDQQEVALGFGPMAGDTLATWIDEREGDPDVYGRPVASPCRPSWATSGRSAPTSASERNVAVGRFVIFFKRAVRIARISFSVQLRLTSLFRFLSKICGW